MATQRASSNILWSTITSLVAGELVTKARLYTEALHRLQDNDGALLGRIARVYSDLVSEAVGTKARIVGNVDMTAFNYDGGVALNGLTVIVDENTTTAQTCTFTNAVTGPDVLLSQLTASCGTNLIWSLNDSGQLVCECQTIGGTSTIALGAGTAHSTIWPSPTITTPGSGTANDGASKIGVGAIGTIPAGTLRAFLTTVETTVANALLKSGGTMTGPIIMGAGGTVSSGQTFTVNGATIAGASTVTGVMTFNAGPTIASGQTLTANGATIAGAVAASGVVTFNGGATIASGQNLTLDGASVQGNVGFLNPGKVWLAGRKQLWRGRVTLADSNHTIDVADGDRFNVPVSPSVPRVITLDHTTIPPEAGETLTFYWFPKTTAIGAGAQYTIRRSDGTVIATFDGSAVIDTGLVWAEFEYTSAGWRLGNNSGTLYDGSAYYGVIGGAGA